MTNLATKMNDVLWALSGLPGYISLDIRSSILARKMRKEEKKEQEFQESATSETDFREVNTEEQEIEVVSTEDVINTLPSTDNSELYNQICRICDDSKALQILLIAKAKNTDKWIQYALYYLSSPEAKLVEPKHDETKMLINAIAIMFGFDKIYDSVDSIDLETCDPNYTGKYRVAAPFIFSIESLKKQAHPLLVQMEERKLQLMAESEYPEEEEDNSVIVTENNLCYREEILKDGTKIIHPIFFKEKKVNEDEYKIKQGDGISDSQYLKLESMFSEFLVDQKYKYSMAETGLINLFIKREIGFGGSTQDVYTIDPGIVMGKDKYYILGNVPNDKIFVSTEHKEIVKKILSGKFYTLTPNEIQEVASDYFHNSNIYRYVDMSNTGFLNKIDNNAYQLIGKKLTFIINQLKNLNDGTTDIPRFRFEKFESCDKFSIVSDEKVKSPLANTNETSSVIASGLSFEVNGDKIVQRLNDLSIEYKIDKYGEL